MFSAVSINMTLVVAAYPSHARLQVTAAVARVYVLLGACQQSECIYYAR